MATVAKPRLRNLNTNVLLQQNFDRYNAFIRAMKVFHISYFHYQNWNPQTYQTYYTEYALQMAEVYGVMDMANNDQRWRTEPTQQIQNENIRITINVFRYIHDGVDSAALMVSLRTLDGHPDEEELALDPTELIQYEDHSILVSTQQFNQLNVENENISINYTDSKNGLDRYDFNEILIPYRRIHPEGYQQWIQFANDIRVLVAVRFDVLGDPANNHALHSFHLHTFALMINYRLIYCAQNPDPYKHAIESNKKVVTYMQNIVDPNTREAFWTTTPDRTTAMNENEVKYIDLQIPDENEGISYEFCLCNEFCNLNAFFHYNPMLRFLMLQHNRLYLINKEKIPEMYTFVLTYCLSDLFTPGIKKPLIRLLDSANQRRILNHEACIEDPQYEQDWWACPPNTLEILGLTYNLLRNCTNMSQICILLDNQPFDEQSLENIHIHYNILQQFHYMIAEIIDYIDANMKDLWFRELDAISRDHFREYIIWSFNETLHRIPGSDYMFTKDYEYSSKMGKSNEECNEMEKHLIITKIHSLPDGNPFNIEFECQPFTNAVIKLLKYFTNFEINLTQLRRLPSMTKYKDFLLDLDTTAHHLSSMPNFASNRVQLIHAFPQHMLPYEQHLLVSYKLKTYFHAFRVQKYILFAIKRYNSKVAVNLDQCFTQFNHIWENDWIENIFPHINERLFRSKVDTIRERLESFYTSFWGKANYELNLNLALNLVMEGVIKEYIKVLHFQQKNGKNRLRFKAISTTLSVGLTRISKNSETILETFIKTFLSYIEIQYNVNEQSITIIETLIYWLVCGSCFMVLQQTAYFLRYLRHFENNQLRTNKRQYILNKGGITQSVKTLNIVYRIIEELRNQFMSFDDIYERISNTLDETKLLVKDLYRDYFKYVSNVWFEEIRDIYITNQPNADLVMKLHLISGLSFVMSFINDFRGPSHTYRRQLLRQRNMILFGTTATMDAFNQFWDLSDNWLIQSNPSEIEEPFVNQYWTQHIDNQLQQFIVASNAQQIATQLDNWFLNIDSLTNI